MNILKIAFAVFFVTTSVFVAKASDQIKAEQVINHMRTIGYTGKGFDKLPENLRLEGWTFKKISETYYDVYSPEGINKRIYEYKMDEKGVTEITMVGDVRPVYLYKRDFCKEIYSASLNTKPEEALSEIFREGASKNNIRISTEDESSSTYARDYANNCAKIFSLNRPSSNKPKTEQKTKANK